MTIAWIIQILMLPYNLLFLLIIVRSLNNLSFFKGEDLQGEKATGSLLSAGPAGCQEIQTETDPGYQGR